MKDLRAALAILAMLSAMPVMAEGANVGAAAEKEDLGEQAVVAGPAESGTGLEANATTDDANDDGQEVIEEITVTEPRPKHFRFQIPSPEFLIETYGGRLKGSKLYHEGRYKEAFPYLLEAAKRGFKVAQARVGYLYLAGLGTERDSETGLVWIGVASRGRTHPEIRHYFNSIWKKLPEEHKPHLTKRIDEFDAMYGAKVNSVNCDFSTLTESRIKKLYCRYMDQCRYWNTAATRELHDCPQWFDPCQNPEAAEVLCDGRIDSPCCALK